MNSKELVSTFLQDLKQYNSTNFRNLLRADLTAENAETFKCCSSVVTRFFIFKEKHPEISDSDLKVLYYALRIDLIAKYFSEYPVANLDDLKPFQEELIEFVSQSSEPAKVKTLAEVS